MSMVAPVAWLTWLWLVLWRSTSPVAILTGVALAVGLTWAMRRAAPHAIRHRVHPIAMARYLTHLVVQLVRSNITLAQEILTPTDYTRPGIVEVRLPPCTELVLTVIANSISLTPGTLTLEIRVQPATIVVHVLHLRDVDAARAEVEHLHRLVSAALVPPPDALGAPTP